MQCTLSPAISRGPVHRNCFCPKGNRTVSGPWVIKYASRSPTRAANSQLPGTGPGTATHEVSAAALVDFPIQSSPLCPSNFENTNPARMAASSSVVQTHDGDAGTRDVTVCYESFRPQVLAAANDPEIAIGPPTGTEIEASMNPVPYQ